VGSDGLAFISKQLQNFEEKITPRDLRDFEGTKQPAPVIKNYIEDPMNNQIQ
jgi:hypothetical protein